MGSPRARPAGPSKRGVGTRDAIVSEALKLASRIGLEGLSLAPLAERLSLSKSGLFAHFKSKEALQVVVIEEAIARFKREVIAPGADAQGPAERLAKVFARYLTWIRGAEDDGGCLFLTVVQEFDDRPGPVRDLLVMSQREWRAFIESVVREGVADGSFRPDTDPAQVAFEFVGAGLSYQHALKLLDDPRAKSLALAAFDRLSLSIRR
jgi:AcrR family transcriptional regulator